MPADAAAVAYGPNLPRLREIKTKYDPGKLLQAERQHPAGLTRLTANRIPEAGDHAHLAMFSRTRQVVHPHEALTATRRPRKAFRICASRAGRRAAPCCSRSCRSDGFLRVRPVERLLPIPLARVSPAGCRKSGRSRSPVALTVWVNPAPSVPESSDRSCTSGSSSHDIPAFRSASAARSSARR